MKKITAILLFLSAFAFSQTNKNYISVEYSSICCGPPSAKPITDYLKKFEKENKLKPFEVFIENGLGKEGEHTIYIGIDNLKPETLTIFWKDLQNIAGSQNSKRKENSDGYVNVDKKLTPNSFLLKIKRQPRTRISSLKIFDYKK